MRLHSATMKLLASIPPLLLLASSASAQGLLEQADGSLPQCGRQCPIITQAVSTCNGGSDADVSTWACFCKNVWSNSNEALATMCAATCTAPADNTAIQQWYTQNCGSDNGATAHADAGDSSSGGSDGSSGGGDSGSDSGSDSSSSGDETSSESSSGSDSSGSSSSGSSDEGCVGSWIDCHWQWVIMVVVLAVGLTILGFGGRWLKKRHDRKKDAINGGFNEGITTRGGGGVPPMSSAAHNDSSFAVGSDAGGRNSPSRTRENFMPYGYGYARSESRVDHGGSSSPLVQGSTPYEDVEKAEEPAPAPAKKSKKVLVKEKLTGGK